MLRTHTLYVIESGTFLYQHLDYFGKNSISVLRFIPDPSRDKAMLPGIASRLLSGRRGTQPDSDFGLFGTTRG